MKKLLSLFLVVLLCFMLASCAKKTSLDTVSAKSAVEELGLFPENMTYVTDEELTSMGLDKDKLNKYLIARPLMNVQSSLYIVALPNKGSETEVKNSIDDFMKSYENMWSQYLPEQYALVENRLVTDIKTSEGTYYVYIISENNDKVLEALKSAVS